MTIRHRDVAQLGSALPWGGRGRQFKSDRSDHEKLKCFLFKKEAFYLVVVLQIIYDKILITS